MEVQLNRIIVVLLFVIAFTTVGYMAPALYASYASSEHYIEVNSFTAQNATVGDDEHAVCLDRNVKKASSATLFVEMYMLDSNSNARVELSSFTLDRYFQHGETAVLTPIELPDSIEPGEYRYMMVVQVELAKGAVEREFEYRSDEFYVTNDARAGDNFDCPRSERLK
jgi:hypothetical protein